MKQKCVACFAGLAMAALILDAKTGLSGAADGITLCLQVVIPSLFPFFLVSMLLNSALLGRNILFLRPVGKLLRIPAGAESLVVVGLLGGYPVGAQSVSQACRDGQLDPKDGRRMLAFCSNAGPAFLFGIGTRLFPKLWICFILWAIHIASSWIVGFLTPGQARGESKLAASAALTLPQAMKKSLNVMAGVCGWVVIFRVMLAFFQRWFLWMIPIEVHLWLRGLIELSNGCCSLMETTSLGLRMVIFSGCLGFGGLCVVMQTYSVCDGMDIEWYLPGKITQSAISILLTIPVQHLLSEEDRWAPRGILISLCCLTILLYGMISRTAQKKSSISAPVGV